MGDLDGTTVLGLKLGALLGEKVGATDLLGAVVLGLQLGGLLGGIVGDELGDNGGSFAASIYAAVVTIMSQVE